VPDNSQYHFVRLVLLPPECPFKVDNCLLLSEEALIRKEKKLFKIFPDIFSFSTFLLRIEIDTAEEALRGGNGINLKFEKPLKSG
jgi:hypothetical protein